MEGQVFLWGELLPLTVVSQANPTTAYNGCCYSTRYSGTAALQTLNNNYFVNGSYSVYRNTVRDTVTYKHSCAVPLEGDVCSICGCGTAPVEPDPTVFVGIDISEWNTITDWSAVAEQVDFVILRVGRTGNSAGGIFKDSSFEENVLGCVENGIPYGLFYYAGATTAEKAREEADAVLGWLNESNARIEFATLLGVLIAARNVWNIFNSLILSRCAHHYHHHQHC